MAYSDYGGHAYLNGEHQIARSDCVLTDEPKSIPGMYPGFAYLMQHAPSDEYERDVKTYPNGHVVLGDGPAYVALYKQTTVRVWAFERQLDLESLATGPIPDECYTDAYGPRRFAPTDRIEELGEMRLAFSLPAAKLDVAWTYEDNYYVYARMVTDSGDVWTGWSGYGVGAGLEDAGYGFSTSDRARTLARLWPETYDTAPRSGARN